MNNNKINLNDMLSRDTYHSFNLGISFCENEIVKSCLNVNKVADFVSFWKYEHKKNRRFPWTLKEKELLFLAEEIYLYLKTNKPQMCFDGCICEELNYYIENFFDKGNLCNMIKKSVLNWYGENRIKIKRIIKKHLKAKGYKI